MENASKEDGVQQILCRLYRSATNLFDYPCPSTVIGVCHVNMQNYRMKMPPKDLLNRAIMIEKSRGTKAIFMSILHEL